MSSPTDKIESGLARHQQRLSSLELLRAAPKTLPALVALAQGSDTKRKNLATRAAGYKEKIEATERIARQDFADVIPGKREEKIRDRIAKTVQSLAEHDKGESTNLAKAIAFNAALGRALAPRFKTPLGYLMVSTVHGDHAAKRRDFLALVADAGPAELSLYIEAALQGGEDAAAMLAACAQRVNRTTDKASRDALMPVLRDAADVLCGVDVRTAQAAVAQMEHAALASEIDIAEIEGRPVSSDARIKAGLAEKDAKALADAIQPEPQAAE